MFCRFISLWFLATVIVCFASGIAFCEKEEIKKMSTVTFDQKEIADAIEQLNGNYAWLLRETDASISVQESLFMKQNTILKVEIDSTSHPVLFFVAKMPQGGYILLTGNSDAFNEIIKAEKLNITDESQALALADLYAEVTQDRTKPLFALNSFSDIPYLSELSAEQLQKKHREQKKYGEMIQPPAITKESTSFRIKRYFLDGKELQRWTMTVNADGTVSVSRETLDPDVGIYYWISLLPRLS
jgi:hypothetical protein